MKFKIYLQFVAVLLLYGCSNIQTKELVPSNAQKVSTVHPKNYARDLFHYGKLSPDGKNIVYKEENDIFLLDGESLKKQNISADFKFDYISFYNWRPSGELIEMRGTIDGERALRTYKLDSINNTHQIIPENVWRLTYSPGGRYLSYFEPNSEKRGIYLIEDKLNAQPKCIVQYKYPISLAFSPDESKLAYLLLADFGFTLNVYSIEDERIIASFDSLDASKRNPIQFTPDGKSILISLVNPKLQTLEERHIPVNNRNLDIYSIELASGTFEKVVGLPGDDMLIGITDEKIFWTNIRTEFQVGIQNLESPDEMKYLDKSTQLSFWHPDGKRLSVMHGQFRMSEFTLNWDIGVYDFNESKEVISSLQPFISGYHEDMGLTWSPDGKWIGYHSHRSNTAVMDYGSEGSTDAIFLMNTDGGDPMELALDGHEIAWPDWAPDSRRMVYLSQDPNSGGREIPHIAQIDHESGELESNKRLYIDGSNGNFWGAVWSPTRPEIALIEETIPCNEYAIWIVSEDAAEVNKILVYEARPLLANLDYSPDGNNIYYSEYINGQQQIMRINREGQQKTQITHGPDNYIFPSISPDGKTISFTRYKNIKELWCAEF